MERAALSIVSGHHPALHILTASLYVIWPWPSAAGMDYAVGQRRLAQTPT